MSMTTPRPYAVVSDAHLAWLRDPEPSGVIPLTGEAEEADRMARERPVPIHRWFAREVQGPLEVLDGVSLRSLGEVRHGPYTYPLLCVEVGARGQESVLISAGIHGDEPAGVQAALDFLRELAPIFAEDFRF